MYRTRSSSLSFESRMISCAASKDASRQSVRQRWYSPPRPRGLRTSPFLNMCSRNAGGRTVTRGEAAADHSARLPPPIVGSSFEAAVRSRVEGVPTVIAVGLRFPPRLTVVVRIQHKGIRVPSWRPKFFPQKTLRPSPPAAPGAAVAAAATADLPRLACESAPSPAQRAATNFVSVISKATRVC